MKKLSLEEKANITAKVVIGTIICILALAMPVSRLFAQADANAPPRLHVRGTFIGDGASITNANPLTLFSASGITNSTAAGTALLAEGAWGGTVVLSSGQKGYFITNSLFSTTSTVVATINTDGAGTSLSNAVTTAGLLKITTGGNVGANTTISWRLLAR